jgi:PucR-like helix-turn-helix protein/diguanylate cyclase with GGDEF domain
VAEDVAALARALADRIDELVDGLEARHPDAIRAWFADRPELVDANRAFERDSMLAELWCLADGARLPAELPAPDAALARMAAQLGSPLQFLLWGYRNGHRVQWEGWLDLVEGLPDAPAGRRRVLLDEGAAFFFAYVDRMSDLVTDEYTRERERALRGLEQRRMRAVTLLLDGAAADASELDYDVAGAHVGAILWGRDGPGAAHELAGTLDRRALVVAVDRGLWWAWLGGARPLGGALEARLAGWSPPAGTAVALGAEASGRAGFRATHRQAGAAHRAGRVRGAGLTVFDDVALEALGAADPETARAFVARELAGLDGDDGRSAALRATLRAWFAHGHNAAATAAALGVHEQTVAQRLRAVQERTGRPPAARRAELETALRLRHYLG